VNNVKDEDMIDNTFSSLIAGTFKDTKLMKIKYKGILIILHDLCNIAMGIRLKKLMEDLNLKDNEGNDIRKLDYPLDKLRIDYTIKERLIDNYNPEGLKYCIIDSKCTLYAYLNYQKQGLKRVTISSCAMNMIKDTIEEEQNPTSKMHYKDKEKTFRRFFPKIDPDVEKDFRRGYAGGYNNTHSKLGVIYENTPDLQLIDYDIVSAYPAEMIKAHPYGKPNLIKDINIKNNIQKIEEYRTFMQEKYNINVTFYYKLNFIIKKINTDIYLMTKQENKTLYLQDIGSYKDIYL
jgi:hypothetical protein